MLEHGSAGLLLLVTIKDHKSKTIDVAVSLDYKDYCKSSHPEEKRSRGKEGRCHASVNEKEGRGRARVREEYNLYTLYLFIYLTVHADFPYFDI